ncbi:hypothetical protein CFC21_071909, partial [Triticum aestivum]
GCAWRPPRDGSSHGSSGSGSSNAERSSPLLCVRRLPGGQRQQQLPGHHGARRLAALRPRLPDPPRHRPLLQRPQRPRHHQRAPRGRARAALPQPPPRRPQAARRRQLCVRRRRHPQRHRHPVCEHHPYTEAAALLRAVPEQGAAADRRAGDAAAGVERAGAHHARRQRLRQQLLPAALLRQVPPVRAPGLRPLPHRRVQDHPPAAPRPRRPPRPRHRLGPIGCAPAELATRSANGECDLELQRAAALYNPQLVQMTKDLNAQFGADVFVAVNAYRMHMDFISAPAAYGFVTSKVACCGQGPYNGVGLCTAMSSVCPDRSLYAFWDNFHPTERANRIIVSQFMAGSPDYMHPLNLSTILAMDAAAMP